MKRILNWLIVYAFVAVLVLSFIPGTVSAMTGSGTVGDPYMIYNVTDLQNISNNLTAYYELANDIDASATSGWNGGLGFAPVGNYTTNPGIQMPENDLVSSGSWTIYPSDGAFFNKTNNNDGDTTYVQATVNDSLFLCGITGWTIPSQATDIYVTITIKARATASGTCSAQPYFCMGGSNYTLGSGYSYSTSYYDKQWNWVETNPATGLPWTPSDINSITAVGAYVSDADPNVRITMVRIWVNYTLVFTGSFDGNGHTISNLCINRPSSDYVGLFGYADYGAIIKDVTLEDASITGSDGTGALVGMIYSYDIPLSSTISDCIIDGGTITAAGGYNSGGLAGYAGGIVIENCYTTCLVSPADCGGGLLGGAFGCEITNCYSTGNVTGNSSWSDDIGGLIGANSGDNIYTDCYATGGVSGYQYIGGFLGNAWGDNTVLNDCYATGDVYGRYGVGGLIGGGGGDNLVVIECYASGDVYCNVESGWALGGFTGELYGDNITVTRCYALGNVDANTSDDVGGFIGYKDSGNNITQCFAVGNVNGSVYVGGFCGEQYKNEITDCYSRGNANGTDKVGGFTGYNDEGTITNSYSTGSASGSTNVGGFCGLNDAGNITDCFWDSETSGNPTSAGGTGKATAQMKTKSTFTDAEWQFTPEAETPVWAIADNCNDGYPYICSFCYLFLICPLGCSSYTLYTSSTLGGNVTTPGEGSFDYSSGEGVGLNTTAESGYSFYRWTGSGTASVGNNYSGTTNITMLDDYIIIANFQSDSLLPMPVIPIITPEEEEADPSILPWYDLIHPVAVGLGWRTIDFWSILIIFVAIAMGVGVMIATGSTLLAAVTVTIVLVVGINMGIFSWWVVIVYAIFSGSYLIAVRSM